MLTEALDRMPHRGAMRLITGIDQADDASIACCADGHMAQDYPLRIGGVLYTASLIELGAQAAAAHASLYGLGQAHMGLVLTVSDVVFQGDRVEDPAPLIVTGTRVEMLALAASYSFEVKQGEAAVVTGNVLLSMEPVDT